MKKLLKATLFMILLMIIITITINIGLRKYYTPTRAEKAEIEEFEKEVREYKKMEQQILERREELEKLADPEIVLEQLQQAGKIISYEGNAGYDDYIFEKTLLGNRKLYMELKYKFAISMDLQYIDIVKIEDTKYGVQVDVRIPKDRLQLEYLSLLANESKLDDDISLFATRFKSKDYQDLLQIAETTTKERIINTKEIWYEAYENMKMEIYDLLMKIDEASDDIKFSVICFVD